MYDSARSSSDLTMVYETALAWIWCDVLAEIMLVFRELCTALSETVWNFFAELRPSCGILWLIVCSIHVLCGSIVELPLLGPRLGVRCLVRSLSGGGCFLSGGFVVTRELVRNQALLNGSSMFRHCSNGLCWFLWSGWERDGCSGSTSASDSSSEVSPSPCSSSSGASSVSSSLETSSSPDPASSASF